MKYIVSIISALILIISINIGCDSALNIKPEKEIDEDKVFANPNLASQALGEAYFAFFEAATGYAYTIGDFSTDIVSTSENLEVFSNGEVLPDGFYVERIWTGYFKTINLANALIKNISQKGTYSEDLMAQQIAEAKFIRAYCYFNMLILYGEGALNGDESGLRLPLKLEPFDGYEPKLNIPRSSTAEIYEQIISDLTTALPDLPVQHDLEVDTRSRATKGSARALLSRIYLYRGDYGEAIKYAEKVRDNTLYELASTCLKLFPPHPDRDDLIEMPQEYIFGFPVSISDLYGPNIAGNNNIAYYAKRTIWANESFINQMSDKDHRKTDLIFQGMDDASIPKNIRERRTTFKFNNRQGQDNVPMIRLAEIMLTEAEAKARESGINAQSITLLNSVRK